MVPAAQSRADVGFAPARVPAAPQLPCPRIGWPRWRASPTVSMRTACGGCRATPPAWPARSRRRPRHAAALPGRARPRPAGRLTIVYGSQTGNAKRLAEQLARQSRSRRPAGAPAARRRLPARANCKDERHALPRHQHPGRRRSAGRRARPGRVHRRQARAAAASSCATPCSAWAIPATRSSARSGRKLDERLAELGATRAAAARRCRPRHRDGRRAVAARRRWPRPRKR